MKYIKIDTKQYADTIRQRFLDNPSLWYSVILPKEKAEELKLKYNGNYAKIWHAHCDFCYKTIDQSTGTCYLGDDGLSWLCEECYKATHKTTIE